MRVPLVYLLIAIAALYLANLGAEQIGSGFHSSIEHYEQEIE